MMDFHLLMTTLKAKYGLDLVKGQYSKEDKMPLYADSGVKCPKCFNSMVKRKSKWGEFFGCSTYPKCDGIVKCKDKDKAVEARFEKTFEKKVYSSFNNTRSSLC